MGLDCPPFAGHAASGAIDPGRPYSPSTILRKLGTASRKNKLYYAFRELGRVIRTISLLEYISDHELRRIIQSAQNKCEDFNNFAQWVYFGSDTIEDNVRDNQLKIIKYNHLIANLLIFHNCHTITQSFKEREGGRLPVNAGNTRCIQPLPDAPYQSLRHV